MPDEYDANWRGNGACALVHHLTPEEVSRKEGTYLRRIIRKNKGGILTNSEINVLVAMVNLWLYHRNGPKGYIHPSREKLAKKTNVTVKTVSRSLDTFRSLGIATAIKHLDGGNGCATQYTISTEAIRSIFDTSGVAEIGGVLVPFSGTFRGENVPVSDGKNVPVKEGKNVPLSYEGRMTPSQDGDIDA